MTYLDTHAVVEFYRGSLVRFSAAALAAVENEDDLRVSPIALLELEYLFEIQRIGTPASKILASLGKEIGLHICDAPFPEVARQALAERWTRDPFDRIIVAQARLRNAPLITRDRHIRARYAHTIG